jgi:hypothetical protein
MVDNIVARIWIITQEIRQKILNISYVDWRKLRFSKGALHYMKQSTKMIGFLPKQTFFGES